MVKLTGARSASAMAGSGNKNKTRMRLISHWDHALFTKVLDFVTDGARKMPISINKFQMQMAASDSEGGATATPGR